MDNTKKPEVWLRGPIENIPALLQPVAYALMQAREEINAMVIDFPEKLLWNQPVGMASVGFHLQHLTGVLDRLFTYAAGNKLSGQQLDFLAKEGKDRAYGVEEMLASFNQQVDRSLEVLSNTDEQTLTEHRVVGRAGLPSTVIGLLVHSAEHTMRHTGQLLVTVNVLKTWI